MPGGSPIEQRWELMRKRLDERQRRTYAAVEAKVIGRGGVSQDRGERSGCLLTGPNPRALRASGFLVFTGATFHFATTRRTGVSSARFAGLGRMGA